jgi:tripartite-type tricarboxylate transporter receptor subunit TctC
MPGAGGLLAVNEMSNSPRDGLTLTIMNGSGMVTNRLAGIEGATYRIEDLEYIGRMVANARVLTMSVNSDYETIEDVLSSDEVIKLGATGLGASGYVDGVISKEVFDLNVQIIHGFDTFPTVRQAMIRGDLAGAWTSWSTARDAYDAGLERVLLQSGRDRIGNLPDVPTVFEFVDRTGDPDRTRKILRAWNALNLVGRPIATTPGTPENRVEFLRNAFRQAMHDPDFLRSAENTKRPVHYASAEETLNIIRSAIEMDDDTQALFVRLIRGEVY